MRVNFYLRPLFFERNIRLFTGYRDLEGKLIDSLQEFDLARGVESRDMLLYMFKKKKLIFPMPKSLRL